MIREILVKLKIVKPKSRKPLHLTNQKLMLMAKTITEKQRMASQVVESKVDWNMLEEMWFDWLEDELFGEDK